VTATARDVANTLRCHAKGGTHAGDPSSMVRVHRSDLRDMAARLDADAENSENPEAEAAVEHPSSVTSELHLLSTELRRGGQTMLADRIDAISRRLVERGRVIDRAAGVGRHSVALGREQAQKLAAKHRARHAQCSGPDLASWCTWAVDAIMDASAGAGRDAPAADASYSIGWKHVTNLSDLQADIVAGEVKPVVDQVVNAPPKPGDERLEPLFHIALDLRKVATGSYAGTAWCNQMLAFAGRVEAAMLAIAAALKPLAGVFTVDAAAAALNTPARPGHEGLHLLQCIARDIRNLARGTAGQSWAVEFATLAQRVEAAAAAITADIPERRAPTFSPGDIVQLRSGSMPMTVLRDVDDDDDVDVVFASWCGDSFDSLITRQRLPAALLRLVSR
jgi:hypothetical protein